MTTHRLVRTRKFFSSAASILITTGFNCPASAHVKWFSNYDLRMQPREVSQIFSEPLFIQLLWAALAVMAIVGWSDNRIARWHGSRPPYRDQATSVDWQPLLLRAGIAIFFLVLALLPTSRILTPELISPATRGPDVRNVQFAVAVAASFKQGAIPGSVGICYLFVCAAGCYGIFHLLDYTIFIAIGSAWVVYSLPVQHSRVLANLALRIGVALTLIWGSLEKFVYPQWGQDLFEQPHLLTLKMGFSSEDFIRNAGFVEFSCAFLLLAGKTSARVCAGVLLFFMIGAIFWFGAIDALGHLLIVISLIIVLGSRNPPSLSPTLSSKTWSAPLMVPALYLLAMLTLLPAYVALYKIFPPTELTRSRTSSHITAAR